MAQSKNPKALAQTEMTVVNTYLILYNFVQALGWSSILFVMALHFATTESYKGMYNAFHILLNVFQTAAIMEVVHILVGFVKSNPMLTFLQVLSRVGLTWGVAYSVPEVQDHIGVTMFVLAWTITEIIRYSFYTLSLMGGEVPYLLTWCRYTFFIVLYPIGVSGELMSIFAALPYVRESGMYSIELPNPANISFSYYYMLHFAILMYIPSFPELYFHMLRQRKKVIGGVSKEKTQ